MKELYLDYISERLGKQYKVWPGKAFGIYSIDGEEAYIQDIYVAPEHRQSGILASFEAEFEQEMKEKGCTHIIGTVKPSANGSTEGLAYCIRRGYKLLNTYDDFIVLRKDLE